jgi:hypothetical protein
MKARDHGPFPAMGHHATVDCEEYLSILPQEEEVVEWLKGEEE